MNINKHRVAGDSSLFTFLNLGNHLGKGEYGDTMSLSQAEPSLISVENKLYVVYSFFRLGMKPSVMIYSVDQKKEV